MPLVDELPERPDRREPERERVDELPVVDWPLDEPMVDPDPLDWPLMEPMDEPEPVDPDDEPPDVVWAEAMAGIASAAAAKAIIIRMISLQKSW